MVLSGQDAIIMQHEVTAVASGDASRNSSSRSSRSIVNENEDYSSSYSRSGYESSRSEQDDAYTTDGTSLGHDSPSKDSYGSVDFATLNMRRQLGEEQPQDGMDENLMKAAAAFGRFGGLSGPAATSLDDPSPNSVLHDVDSESQGGRFPRRKLTLKKETFFGKVGENEQPSLPLDDTNNNAPTPAGVVGRNGASPVDGDGEHPRPTPQPPPRPPPRPPLGRRKGVFGGLRLGPAADSASVASNASSSSSSNVSMGRSDDIFLEREEATGEFFVDFPSDREAIREAHLEEEEDVNELAEVDIRRPWRKEMAEPTEGDNLPSHNDATTAVDEKEQNDFENYDPSNFFAINEAMNRRLAVDDELYRIGFEFEKESLDAESIRVEEKSVTPSLNDDNASSVPTLRRAQQALGWNYDDVRSEVTASSSVNKSGSNLAESKKPSAPLQPYKRKSNSSDRKLNTSDKRKARATSMKAVKEEPEKEDASMKSPRHSEGDSPTEGKRRPSAREVRQKIAKKMGQVNRRSSHGSPAAKAPYGGKIDTAPSRPTKPSRNTPQPDDPSGQSLPDQVLSNENTAVSPSEEAASESGIQKHASPDDGGGEAPNDKLSSLQALRTTTLIGEDSENKAIKGEEQNHGRKVDVLGDPRVAHGRGPKKHRRRKKNHRRSRSKGELRSSEGSRRREYIVGLNDLMGSEISTPDPGEEKMEEEDVMAMERGRSDLVSLSSNPSQSRDQFDTTKKLRMSESARRARELAARHETAPDNGGAETTRGSTVERLRGWGQKALFQARENSDNTDTKLSQSKRTRNKVQDRKHLGLQIQSLLFGPQCWQCRLYIAIGIICLVLILSVAIPLAKRGGEKSADPEVVPTDPVYVEFQTIEGIFENDSAGAAVSFSNDGRILAVGYSSEGVVRVFQRGADGQRFEQLGQELEASEAEDLFGSALALSGDGTRVVVGARDNNNGGGLRGETRVFSFVNELGMWMQLGSTISGLEADGTSGFSVDFSADGNRIAVGSPRVGNAGSVTVYELIGEETWTLVGEVLVGRGDDERFGYDVSLNDDGSRVAVSAIRATIDDGELRGRVQVFSFVGTGTNGVWTPFGNDIVGVASGDLHGQSVELDSTGLRIAVGSNGHDNSISGTKNVGACRVYDFTATGWTQLGGVMEGELRGEQSGISLAISSNGTVIACGGAKSPVNGDDSGVVRAYRLQGASWEQIGDDLVGVEGSGFGSSLAFSKDAEYLAVGAPETTISFLLDVGVVHLFGLEGKSKE